MFVDWVKIEFCVGCGGNGCFSFCWEWYIFWGGFDGGDGGDGGDVIIVVEEGVNSFVLFFYYY